MCLFVCMYRLKLSFLDSENSKAKQFDFLPHFAIPLI